MYEITEREALIALFNATDGPNWQHNDNWASDAPIGQWYGVTVNSEGSVTKLTLDLNRLSGEIPPELGNLASLTILNLGSNRLSGKIPAQLGNLAILTWLNLGNNQLSEEIPPELGNLPGLDSLDLSGNRLSGRYWRRENRQG